MTRPIAAGTPWPGGTRQSSLTAPQLAFHVAMWCRALARSAHFAFRFDPRQRWLYRRRGRTSGYA